MPPASTQRYVVLPSPRITFHASQAPVSEYTYGIGLRRAIRKQNLAVLARLVEGLASAALEVREMEQQGEGGTEGPTYGCMQCKARQRYIVEELRNRNTLWRCAVCGYVMNLIPGQYTADSVETGRHA